MPPVGFELTISAGERPQTYALDRVATDRSHGPYRILNSWCKCYNQCRDDRKLAFIFGAKWSKANFQKCLNLRRNWRFVTMLTGAR
jgi:hypothetical protein